MCQICIWSEAHALAHECKRCYWQTKEWFLTYTTYSYILKFLLKLFLKFSSQCKSSKNIKPSRNPFHRDSFRVFPFIGINSTHKIEFAFPLHSSHPFIIYQYNLIVKHYPHANTLSLKSILKHWILLDS